jgi:glycosyltransferase involved in cell wall biosynthesis
LKLIFEILAIKAIGYKFVWTLHNEVPHDIKYPALFRRLQGCLARLADFIVVHSQAGLDQLRPQLGASAGNVEIIPHGDYQALYGPRMARNDARRLLGLSPEKKVLLYFGLICPYKGVDDLLLAWRQIGSVTNAAQLLIVGRFELDSYAAQISSQIKELQNVILRAEFVPIEAVSSYFSAADCVVLPFRKILTSGSLSLALSYSLPVIVPDLSTVRAEVASQDGWFFRPGDTAALGSAIREAILAPLQASYAPRHGRLWDWDEVAAATHKVYEAAVKQSSVASTAVHEAGTDGTTDPELKEGISAKSGPDAGVVQERR